jgi:hypothetical protein
MASFLNEPMRMEKRSMFRKLAVIAIIWAAGGIVTPATAGTCSPPIYRAANPAVVMVAPCGTAYVSPAVIQKTIVHKKVVRVRHARRAVAKRRVHVVRRVVTPAYDTYSEALRWYPRYTEYVIGCPDPLPWWAPTYPHRACCGCGQRPVLVASAPCKIPH